MLNCMNNQLISDENSQFSLSAISVLGDREDQQDSFGYELRSEEGFVVVCDGMGGHQGGKLAGELAAGTMLSGYRDRDPSDDVMQVLLQSARLANDKICSLKNSEGQPLNAGSTLVSVLIRDRSLMWCSVGDSRAYLIRGDEMVQLTQDQNYFTVLEERRNAGLITPEQFEAERGKGEALISFLGIGQLQLIDYSAEPFALEEEDKIIIMSDGLYKIVSDEEILRILDNFSSIREAVQALEMKAQKNARKTGISRDNMTAAIIKIK